MDKEYDRKVDHHEAQVYLREYQKRATERGEGIFLPEVMEKYYQYKQRKILATNKVNIDYVGEVLKKTLEGDDKFIVEFDNKEDNLNFILDIVSAFKRNLKTK